MRLKLGYVAADCCERRLQSPRRRGQAAVLDHGQKGRHGFQTIHRNPLPSFGRIVLDFATSSQTSEGLLLTQEEIEPLSVQDFFAPGAGLETGRRPGPSMVWK